MSGDSSGQEKLPLDPAWLRRVEATEAFEEEWRSGAGCIASKLPLVLPTEQIELLHELIKIDLEYRWEQGEHRKLEEYLHEFPVLGTSRELPVDLIVEEFRVRADHGEIPSQQELESRFPEQAAQVREQLRQSTPDRHKILQRLGRYELRERIGRGGFAMVYRAWDPVLHREIAVKVVHEGFCFDEVTMERVQREARSMARLRHPAIVPILEIGHDDGRPFIVYELLPGPNLAELAKHQPPKPRDAAVWTLRIAEALDYAHSQGVIHRDVKPSNILLDANREPVLADFGLARNAELEATLTRHGDILGTPAYMSPEQASGDIQRIDGRSDVYGLGAVLYELLSGQPPFAGSAASVLQQVLGTDPSPPSSLRTRIPFDLETICLKAMAKELRRRYATAGAMAADLRAFLESRPISARRTGTLGRAVLWGSRNRTLAVTLAVSLLLLVLVTTGAFWQVLGERNRFLSERKVAVANLHDALVRESHAIRMARETGYRSAAWQRLQQALALDLPAHDLSTLRSEAVACLGDFVGLEPAVWSNFGPPEVEHVVTALAFSTTRDQVAIGIHRGQILLRDVSGERIADLPPHASGVYALDWASRADAIASMDDHGTIRVWRTSGEGWYCGCTIEGPASAEPGLIVAVSCAISSDGTRLVSCAKGESVIHLWDANTGEQIREFRGPNEQLFVRATLSPDESAVVGAYRDPVTDGLVIWDLATGAVRKVLPVTQQAIVDIAFSADGEYLACACNNGTFVIDTESWQRQLWVHSDDQFFTIAFHPKLPWLAIPNSRKHSLLVWDVSANEKVAELTHPGMPHSVSFAPDGHRLFSATGTTVRVWNLKGDGEKRVLPAHTGIVNGLVFRPDGAVLASAGHDGRVRLWNPVNGECVGQIRVVEDRIVNVSASAFSADGQQLGVVDWVGNAVVFDVADPANPRPSFILLRGELGGLLWDITASPDGQYWAVAAQNGVRVWRNGKLLATPVSTIAHQIGFSPDSSRLGWYSNLTGEVAVWDVEQQRFLDDTAIPRFDQKPAFVPNKNYLLAVGAAQPNAPRTVFDLRASKPVPLAPLLSSLSPSDAGLTNYLVSRHGTYWGIENEQPTLRDLAGGRRIVSLPANEAPPQPVAMSPDERYLALGLTNGKIIVWDLVQVRRQLESIGLAW